MFTSQILGCRNKQAAASWLEEKQAGVRFTCAPGPESDLVGATFSATYTPPFSRKLCNSRCLVAQGPGHLKEFRRLSVVMAGSSGER